MHRFRRERRQTDSDVLGAFRMRSAVLHPFSRRCQDRLARLNIEHALLVSHPQAPLEDQCELVKFWCLSGFDPAEGLRIRAILKRDSREFTRPMNSSMIFGLLPAAETSVGELMSRGIRKSPFFKMVAVS